MENQFNNQMKQFMNNWQQRLQDLQVQFSLGKMDAADAFEKQKDQMRGYLTTMKENLDKATTLSEEKATEMRTRFEELRVQLALGKADGLEAFEDQRKRIEAAMNEFYAAGKLNFNEAYQRGIDLFDQNATAFKTGLEIVKLQYALAKMDAKDDLAEQQKALGEKINELNQQYMHMQKSAMDNMEEMNRQLRDNFEKMRTFAEGWFRK